MANYTWKELTNMLWAETHPQTNYHGTPYTFNKFDDSKFLTGEGNLAHGPGHYSADLLNTAEKYKEPRVSVLKDGKEVARKLLSPNFVDRLKDSKAHYPDIFKTEYEYELGSTKNTLDKTLTKFNKGSSYYKPLIERLKTKLDFLENMDRYKTIRSEGNLYKVNVPNEYFMWKENVPLNQQNNYIQSLWQRRNIDFAKMLSPYGTQLEHDLEGLGLRNIDRIFNPMYDQLEYRGGLNDVTKRLFNRYMNELPLDKQLKFLERSDNLKYLPEVAGEIKGKRAIGMSDGPINVTFTGDNIRMANTPWQRFVNRIPTQTISVIGQKLMGYPLVRNGINFANRATIPLMIYQGLSQPTARDEDYFLKGGIEYNDYQY